MGAGGLSRSGHLNRSNQVKIPSALRSGTPTRLQRLPLILWGLDHVSAAAPCSRLHSCHPRPVNRYRLRTGTARATQDGRRRPRRGFLGRLEAPASLYGPRGAFLTRAMSPGSTHSRSPLSTRRPSSSRAACRSENRLLFQRMTARGVIQPRASCSLRRNSKTCSLSGSLRSACVTTWP